MKSQQGIAHLLLIIIVLIGLVVGVWLVTNRTSFFSQAANETKLEVFGTHVSFDYGRTQATSRLIGVKPIYKDSGPQPTMYRLANDPTKLSQGVIYPYTDPSKSIGNFWLLPPTTGKEYTIYAQFLVDNEWTETPTTAKVFLAAVTTTFPLKVTCDSGASFGANGGYKVALSWDSTLLNLQPDVMAIQVFDQSGKEVYSQMADPKKPQQWVFVDVPQAADRYAAFATAAKGSQILGTSEINFACTKPLDGGVVENSPQVSCLNGADCVFSWRLKDPSTLAQLTVWEDVYQTNQIALTRFNRSPFTYVKVTPNTPGTLKANWNYPAFSVQAFTLADDPVAAGSLEVNYGEVGPGFNTADQTKYGFQTICQNDGSVKIYWQKPEDKKYRAVVFDCTNEDAAGSCNPASVAAGTALTVADISQSGALLAEVKEDGNLRQVANGGGTYPNYPSLNLFKAEVGHKYMAQLYSQNLDGSGYTEVWGVTTQQFSCDPTADNQPRAVEARDDCLITGCNSEICSDRQSYTTCSVPSSCNIADTICQRQANGRCGWNSSGSTNRCN